MFKTKSFSSIIALAVKRRIANRLPEKAPQARTEVGVTSLKVYASNYETMGHQVNGLVVMLNPMGKQNPELNNTFRTNGGSLFRLLSPVTRTKLTPEERTILKEWKATSVPAFV